MPWLGMSAETDMARQLFWWLYFVRHTEDQYWMSGCFCSWENDKCFALLQLPSGGKKNKTVPVAFSGQGLDLFWSSGQW